MKKFLFILLFLTFYNVNAQSITNQNVIINIDGDMVRFKLNKENSHKIIELINIKTKKIILKENVNCCNLEGKSILVNGDYLFRVTTIFYNNRKHIEEKIFIIK